MILHLLTDEKFTDYAIKQFTAPEMESEFVLVPSNNMMEYVKLVDRCTIIRQNSPEFEELLNRLSEFTGIIFHGLFWGRWQTPILQRIPDQVKIAWVFWSGEIFALPELESQFLAPITGVLNKLHTIKKSDSSATTWNVPLELYKRIDYCMTSLREEYEFAKEFTGSSFEHLWFTYYSMEETIGEIMSSHCKGSNIWLGNSAAKENNHVDALWKIYRSRRCLSLGKRTIIAPLSYGGPWVGNLVSRIANMLFGSKFKALNTYIPRNEYNELMLSCSTMIINYWEPAAQGNIITALWLGMRVYISERNLTYKFFKRIGALVYSFESEFNKYGYTELSKEERQYNRDILSKWYSKKHMMEAVADIVKKLSTPKK